MKAPGTKLAVMSGVVLSALLRVGSILWDALVAISIPAAIFVILAVIVKGRGVLVAARRAAKETRINFSIYVVDVFLVAPCLAALIAMLFTGKKSVFDHLPYRILNFQCVVRMVRSRCQLQMMFRSQSVFFSLTLMSMPMGKLFGLTGLHISNKMFTYTIMWYLLPP